MYNTPYQNQMNMQIPVQNNLALVKGYFRKKSVLAAGIFAAILAAVEFISIFFSRLRQATCWTTVFWADRTAI